MKKTSDIIDRLVLGTGKSRRDCQDFLFMVIDSITDAASNGEVIIAGLGAFEGRISTRRYFDIKEREMKISVKPKVGFTPDYSFVNKVDKAQKQIL